jgi:hypothetical protein
LPLLLPSPNLIYSTLYHRAKCKLIIIGSLEILERVPVLHELKRFLKDRKWVVDLSPGALDRTEQIMDV